ncbi:unnamed protein product, partial [Vitis vinifera]
MVFGAKLSFFCFWIDPSVGLPAEKKYMYFFGAGAGKLRGRGANPTPGSTPVLGGAVQRREDASKSAQQEHETYLSHKTPSMLTLARRYNMGESLWTVFCGSSWCWSKIGKICSSGFLAIVCPCSCLNHILVISVDIIVLLYLLFIFIYKASAMKILSPQQSRCFSTMLNSAAFLNGSLGLVYLGLGFWIVGEKLRLRLCSVLAFFIAGFPCVTSFWEAIVGDAVSVKVILDVISFPGAILLMFCTFTGPKYAGTDSGFDGAAFYRPLPGEGSSAGDKINTDASLPPFEKAGLISRMSFWWLNSLMKKGKQKTLEDKDIPQLRREDRAEMCYLMFMEQQNKQKQQAFILVAEGKEAFKYEGYALTGGLFLTKCLESLSERQWFFRTRLIGLQVRSFLSAAIYQKQLKLSNTAKGLYSPAQIVSFVIIDAYNIALFKGYSLILFWSSPIVVSAITFTACYFIGTTLSASNVFTFMASLRIAQEPIRLIPDVITAFIEAKESIFIKSNRISWEDNSTRATLRNINLVVKPGERVAICGEVGSGKSTLLAAILGEVPHINGIVRVYGKIAYVSQTAWIPTGTIQENILFGSAMDPYRYREAIEKCALVKDLEMLPFGDLTEIGERGVNLSGGQKQRVQLARALYQDADVYLLDDPFSAVDAHTATSLFNEYVMGALSTKTVILVTHQVDFLPAFDSVLLMSEGEILQAATFEQLMHSSQEFQDLVNAHNATVRSERQPEHDSTQKSKIQKGEIQKIYTEKQLRETSGEQLIKKEERETGDTGLKPYLQYLKYSKGFLYFFLATLSHITFIVEQLVQNYWLAANIHNSSVSQLKLITVYTGIGLSLSLFLLLRSFFVVLLGLGASQSIFSTLLSSLFRAPMSFYDSTPLGRILSRVSSDLSVVDLDVAFKFTVAVGTTMNAYANFGVLTILAWELVFVILPTIYLSILIQRYYFAAGKELMRINGTTKSFVASHLSESIAGAMTIRAFGEEDRHFSKNLGFIDMNASPFFYSFTANEWLILRLEILSAIVLSSSGLALTLLHTSTSKSGFIGMALSYGLSANVFLVFSVQNQCHLANMIVSVERLEQYTNIPSEAPEVIESNRPPVSWPTIGEVEIYDLKVKYRPNAPLVLHGISCKFGGGQKIGIVGRTGSGKTTLISILFRLVEPTEGQIIIDGIDIATIGLHDLRSRLGIIPQEPTLFSGSVRYNLDPLSLHTDEEIWVVLEKCQLRGAVQEKEEGLDSLVVQDGSNWSMGQRQLFCLGRALLRRSRILVLDEATASIDNATDSILQKTIRTEFADCTVITVAHRIPTVMDCTMVLAISDGKLVEYDEPMKLIKEEGSLFGQLVKEYWSRSSNGSNASGDWL